MAKLRRSFVFLCCKNNVILNDKINRLVGEDFPRKRVDYPEDLTPNLLEASNSGDGYQIIGRSQ